MRKTTREGFSPISCSKFRTILSLLDEAESIEDLGLPGFRLHPLKGKLRGSWSISVSGNWRIIFRFERGNAFDIELLDYH